MKEISRNMPQIRQTWKWKTCENKDIYVFSQTDVNFTCENMVKSFEYLLAYKNTAYVF